MVIAADIVAGLGVFGLGAKGKVLGMGIKAAAADVSVECIFEGESPRARSGGRRRGKNVAKEAGLGVASRHRGLARHVVKGLSEIVPIFETVFVQACHYAVSKLCKGMSHHNEVRHVSSRLHIHQFRPWAPVPLPGVCFLTNAHGSPIK